MGKAKGTTIVNAIKFLRKNKDAAQNALPKRLSHYLNERILISAWYPEEDCIAIFRCLAAVIPDPGVNIFEYMGRLAARADLEGIYANLIIPGNPAATLRRRTVVWQMYHDTGKNTVVDFGDDFVVSEISDFENPCREYCSINMGWHTEMVVISGGKKPVSVHEKCVVDGEDVCRFRVTWTN